MLPAIVLAAGESMRMGSPKALLPDPDGRPFVVRIVNTLLSAGLGDIIVVTGSQHALIEAVLTGGAVSEAVRLVRNPDPSRGQLSSIWTGLAACSPSAEGLLMTLVDVPMVTRSTVVAVVNAWRDTHAPVVRPIVDGRRGHPVIFGKQIFDELKHTPLETGARAVVRAHWAESVDVEVQDRDCLVDVDTPADYDRLRRRHQ